VKWSIDTDGVYMPIDTLTHTFGSDVVEMTLLALPFMALAAAIRVRMLRRRVRPVMTGLLEAAAGLYTAALGAVTLLPGGDRLNKPVAWSLWSSDLGYAPERAQVMGNFVLLAPLALMLALRWPRLTTSLPAAAMCLAMPLTIETAQYFGVPGRVASGEDLLLGVAGSALGVAAAGFSRRIAQRALSDSPSAAGSSPRQP